MREPVVNGIKWNTNTDFNHHPCYNYRVLEHLDRVSEGGFLGVVVGRIGFDSVGGILTFFLGEARESFDSSWKNDVGKDGKGQSAETFDQEENLPSVQLGGVDLKNTKTQETRKGIGDCGSCVKNTDSGSKFPSSVESREVVNDGWEKRAFHGTQE